MSLRTYYLRKKFWLNDFLHGGKMWSAFKEIEYINTHIEEGEKIRQKKLADIIKFAKENTKFYSKIKGNNLEDFPVIDKQTILADRESFLVPEGNIPGQVGRLHVQTTSGSSGIPFALPQDTECRTRRIALIKYGNEIIGFHSFDRLMHLRSFKHYWKDAKDDVKLNKELNIIYANNNNLDENKALRLCNCIIKNNVKFVRGYMTTLDTLTRVAVEHDVSFPNKLIFISVGEPLSETLRLRVKDKLHCGIISQYGNEENGIFGQSDINEVGSTMRLNLANCFIEILKFNEDRPVEKGELGRIVVTDLTNHAMPMIRYDIGDVASIGLVKKGVMLTIENLIGRKTDLIYKTNGESLDFYNTISTEIFLNEDIRQFQFIQKKQKQYLLRLNVRDETLKEYKHHYIQLIKDVLGADAEVAVEFTEEIPVMNSGKRKVIINEWKKGKT